MISYYSDRGGLGGVSIVTEKGEVTVSQLLIKGATVKDQVQFGFLKFVFSKKATKNDEIFTVDLTLTT